jgi:hypothetical protein
MLPEKPKKKVDDAEKDLGFGQSHGYDAQHGGPTGPGDAPAKPLPKSPSKRAAMSDAFRLGCRVSGPRAPKFGAASDESGGCRVD